MQRLQNLDMSRCPSVYPDDIEENPFSFETFMHSMHMALSGMNDEALMDIEEKYGKNYQHFAVIRPPWMSLEPLRTTISGPRSSRSRSATKRPFTPSGSSSLLLASAIMRASGLSHIS